MLESRERWLLHSGNRSEKSSTRKKVPLSTEKPLVSCALLVPERSEPYDAPSMRPFPCPTRRTVAAHTPTRPRTMVLSSERRGRRSAVRAGFIPALSSERAREKDTGETPALRAIRSGDPAIGAGFRKCLKSRRSVIVVALPLTLPSPPKQGHRR